MTDPATLKASATQIVALLSKSNLVKRRLWARRTTAYVRAHAPAHLPLRALNAALLDPRTRPLLAQDSDEAVTGLENIFFGYLAYEKKGLPDSMLREDARQAVLLLQKGFMRHLEPSLAAEAIDGRSASRDAATHAGIAELGEALVRIESGQVAPVGEPTDLTGTPPILARYIDRNRAAFPDITIFAVVICDMANPVTELVAWSEHPPAWSAQNPAVFWGALAHCLSVYGRHAETEVAMSEAIEAGIVPQTQWRARLALHVHEHDLLSKPPPILEPSGDFLVEAIRLSIAGIWKESLAAAESWETTDVDDANMKVGLRVKALVNMGRFDDAIDLLEESIPGTDSAGHRRLAAQLLASRAQRHPRPTGEADLRRAVVYAVEARDLVRIWSGDSSQATLAAAQASALLHDWAAVFHLIMPAPHGEATAAESGSPEVIQLGAMAAAVLGRRQLARKLAARSGPFEGAFVEAIIGDAEGQWDDFAASRARWRDVWNLAVTDEQKVSAARCLLAAGGEIDSGEEILLSYERVLRPFMEIGRAIRSAEQSGPEHVAVGLRLIARENGAAAHTLSQLLQDQGKVALRTCGGCERLAAVS